MEETRFPGYNICALFKGQLKKNIYEIYFLIGDLDKVYFSRIAKVFYLSPSLPYLDITAVKGQDTSDSESS